MLTILIAVVWKKKWTSKKQVDGDCVVYHCARSSIVDKRLQNAKKKGNGFFYSTISSENQFTSNPLKQTERSNAMQLNVIKNMNGGGATGNSKENSN